MNPDKATQVTEQEAISMGLGKCSKCWKRKTCTEYMRESLNLSEETIPSLKKLYEKKSSLQLSLNALQRCSL